MDCGTKRDWSTVPKQYRCGSRLVPWQDYFGTDTVLEFLLGIPSSERVWYPIICDLTGIGNSHNRVLSLQNYVRQEERGLIWWVIPVEVSSASTRL